MGGPAAVALACYAEPPLPAARELRSLGLEARELAGSRRLHRVNEPEERR